MDGAQLVWTRLEQHYAAGGGKFWAVAIDTTTNTVHTKWGKLTDPGLMSSRTFVDLAAAQKSRAQKLAQKLSSGYSLPA